MVTDYGAARFLNIEAKSGGDPATARRYYQDWLEIAKQLYDAAPENADYARDLWVSIPDTATEDQRNVTRAAIRLIQIADTVAVTTV